MNTKYLMYLAMPLIATTANPYQAKLEQRGIFANGKYQEIYTILKDTPAKNLIINVHKKNLVFKCAGGLYTVGCINLNTRVIEIVPDPMDLWNGYTFQRVLLHEAMHSEGYLDEDEADYQASLLIKD